MFKYIVSVLFALLVFFSLQADIIAQSEQDKAVYDKLTQIFEPEIVGTTIAYLETILGPAKKIDKWGDEPSDTTRHYLLGNCEIDVTGTDAVSTIMLKNVSNKCNFNFEEVAFYNNYVSKKSIDILGQSLGSIYQLIMPSESKIVDECSITDCGVAGGNPKIGFEFLASIKENLIVSAWYISDYENEKSLSEQYYKFIDYMKAKYGDEVRFGEYELRPEDIDQALSLWQNLPVKGIKIGNTYEQE
jgi:hypothetical protein